MYVKTVLNNMMPKLSVSDGGSMLLRKDDLSLNDYTMYNYNHNMSRLSCDFLWSLQVNSTATASK
jgi:hypothetical protein